MGGVWTRRLLLKTGNELELGVICRSFKNKMIYAYFSLCTHISEVPV